MYICKFPIIAGEETGKGWYASIDSDYILYYDFDTNEYSFNQEPCDSRPVFNPECNELLPIKAFNNKFKMLTGGTMVQVFESGKDLDLCLEAKKIGDLMSYMFELRVKQQPFLGLKDLDLNTFPRVGGIHLVHILNDGYLKYGVSLSTAGAYLLCMNKELYNDLRFLCFNNFVIKG